MMPKFNNRVMIVLNSFYWGGGGSEIICITLAEQLIKRGWDVQFAIIHQFTEFPSSINNIIRYNACFKESFRKGNAHLVKRYLRKPWRFLKIFLWLTMLIYREKPNIIHTHQPYGNIWGVFVARLVKVPVIISSIHGSFKQFGFSSSRCKLLGCYRVIKYCLFDRFTSLFANRLVAVSEATRQDLIEANIKPECLYVIHNGISATDIEKNDLYSNRICHNNQYVIAMMSNIVPIKGHDILFKAAAHLRKEHPSIKIILSQTKVQDERFRYFIDQLAKDLKINDIIQYSYDPIEVWKKGDVFIFPSRSEGLPVAILEAMLQRKPIIASRVGGIPEILVHGESGWLFEPCNWVDLANGLKTILINTELRCRLGKAAQFRVRIHFSAERMGEMTSNLYNYLITNKSGS